MKWRTYRASAVTVWAWKNIKLIMKKVFFVVLRIFLYCYLLPHLDTKEGVSLSTSPFTSVLTSEYGKVLDTGPQGTYFLGCRVAHFSVRRSSVWCSVAQNGAALLRRVQRSSEGRSIAQRVQLYVLGCSIAQKGPHSSEECSVAHRGAA